MPKRTGEEQAAPDAGRFTLMAGESVHDVEHPSRFIRFPRYLLTLGLYGLWRKRDTSVVTNRRLLIGKGIMNRKERSIPMGRVRDANYGRKWFSSYAEVVVEGHRGRETLKVGPMSAKHAHRFASFVQEQL
jgi:hypothetical protein